MYRIVCVDGTVLYDQNDVNEDLVASPTCDMEIGQAGSLKFKLLPGHRLYNLVQTMETYMSAYDDDKEIFYGRIIDISDNRVTGEREVTCAGALQFLEDAEIAPFDENSDGERTINMTGAAFLVKCIQAYHSEIRGDDRRLLDVGDIYHTKHNNLKDFTISSYTQVKSAIDSNLLGDYEYGGFLMIGQPNPSAPHVHMIHWIQSFTECNNSPIQLALNVQSQDNVTSSNNFFTAIRPIGEDDLMLDEEILTVSDEIAARYGLIVKTVSFSDKDNQEDLRTAAQAYIDWYSAGLGKTSTVKVIDMNYLDGTIPKLFLGNAYTNIDGFEGETMVISAMHWDFADPKNNTVTLKNARDLASTQGGSSGGGGGGSTGSSSSSNANAFENIYNHITESENKLVLDAKEIEIHAELLEESANQFERFSEETNNGLNYLKGTEVIQNSATIAQVAGSYSIKYRLVPDSWLKETGKNPHDCYYYEPHSYYITQEAIDNDFWYGKELFYSVSAAVNGEATIPTNKEAGVLQNLCNDHTAVYQMERTNDTTPQPFPSGLPNPYGREYKEYYYRIVGTSNGTEIVTNRDGQEVTIISELKSHENNIQVIEGSALWTQRNHITGVCGEYEIKTDATTGERTIVIKSGGGMVVRKDGVEYGVYNDYNMTGGILVDKINADTTLTKIIGSRVDIQANQVKVGSTSDVQTWLNLQDDEMDEMQGLIADRATIAQLNAQKARIDDINANKLTATYINSLYDSAHTLSCHNFSASGSVSFTFTPDYGQTLTVSADSLLKKLKLVKSGNTYTLKYLSAGLPDADGNYLDVGSFSRATSLSGAWSSGKITVTASPQDETWWNLLQADAATLSGNVYTVPIKAVWGDSGQYSESTGLNVTVDASARYTAGYNAGVPTGATLGSKVTGTTWNVSIQRSTGSAVGKTINLSSAYTDARSGYYTKAQYDANYTSGYNASHTIGIYDVSGNAVSSQSITSAISLWAGMKKSDGSFQWGGQVTITPSASHPNSITFTYDGMSSSQSGGQTIYTYKYHLTNTSGYQPASGRTTFYY